MSLITPIAVAHSAFDATKDTTFYFNVGNGGDQVVANRITIRTNTDNTIVYQSKINTLVFSQTVPANTLTNGVYYNLYFNTYNANDDISTNSNSIQFYCLSEPILTPVNYYDNIEINASHFVFQTEYNQDELEYLSSIHHVLTDTTINEVIEDVVEYAKTTDVPYLIEKEYLGLLNGDSFKYELDITTANGLTQSTSCEFTVAYEQPTFNGILELENLCEDGLIKINSGLSVINGVGTNMSYETYSGDVYADMEYLTENPSEYITTEVAPNVIWNEQAMEGVTLSSDSFSLLAWFKPNKLYNGEPLNTRTEATILQLKGDSEDSRLWYNLVFERVKQYGETDYSDCVELFGGTGDSTIVNIRSNYITSIGTSNDSYLIYFTKSDNTYNLILTKLNTSTSSIEWNGSSNVEYGKITNLLMHSNDATTGEEFVPQTGVIGTQNINYLSIKNGMFNHLTIYHEVVPSYLVPISEWLETMSFNCNFNNNVQGGTLNIDNVTMIEVKKRLKDSATWVTLYTKEASATDVTSFELYDGFSASDVEYVYALVPVTSDGTEGDYITKEVYSIFSNFYLVDNTDIFKFAVNVSHNITDSTEYGLLQPLNKRYPVVIQNGETRYNKGSSTSAVMGYKYFKTRQLDPVDIRNMRNDVCDFLNNGNIKIMKGWSGDIIVLQKIGDITRSVNSATGYSSLGFQWVEQGKHMDADLYSDGRLQAMDFVPPSIEKANS